MTVVGFEEGLKGRPRYVLGSELQYSGLHKENETQWHQNNSGWFLTANDSYGLHMVRDDDSSGL